MCTVKLRSAYTHGGCSSCVNPPSDATASSSAAPTLGEPGLDPARDPGVEAGRIFPGLYSASIPSTKNSAPIAISNGTVTGTVFFTMYPLAPIWWDQVASRQVLFGPVTIL
eukprot:g7551.t1